MSDQTKPSRTEALIDAYGAAAIGTIPAIESSLGAEPAVVALPWRRRVPPPHPDDLRSWVVPPVLKRRLALGCPGVPTQKEDQCTY